MDQYVGQCYLKFTPPLCILVKSITEGVHISFGSAQWAILPDIDTPCVKGVW